MGGLLLKRGSSGHASRRRRRAAFQAREPSLAATMPARARPIAVRRSPSGKRSGRSSRTIGAARSSAGGPTRQSSPAAAMRIDGFISVSNACCATVSSSCTRLLERCSAIAPGKEEERRKGCGEGASPESHGAPDESRRLMGGNGTSSIGGLGAMMGEKGASSMVRPLPGRTASPAASASETASLASKQASPACSLRWCDVGSAALSAAARG